MRIDRVKMINLTQVRFSQNHNIENKKSNKAYMLYNVLINKGLKEDQRCRFTLLR